MPARLAYFLINDVTTFIKGLQEGHAFLNNAANTSHTRGSKYASLVPYLDYCKVLPLYSIDDDMTGPGLHVPSSQPYQPHVNASCILEQLNTPTDMLCNYRPKVASGKPSEPSQDMVALIEKGVFASPIFMADAVPCLKSEGSFVQGMNYAVEWEAQALGTSPHDYAVMVQVPYGHAPSGATRFCTVPMSESMLATGSIIYSASSLIPSPPEDEHVAQVMIPVAPAQQGDPLQWLVFHRKARLPGQFPQARQNLNEILIHTALRGLKEGVGEEQFMWLSQLADIENEEKWQQVSDGQTGFTQLTTVYMFNSPLPLSFAQHLLNTFEPNDNVQALSLITYKDKWAHTGQWYLACKQTEKWVNA